MKIVFTDGSASPNPGPGGFSVIDATSGEPLILGRCNKSTNIRMEGEAILAAMSEFSEVEIYTDSEIWVNVITKWADSWYKKGWHKKNGVIQNLDLAQRLYKKYISNKVQLVWVRGHVGTELNEKADEWANNARERKSFSNLEIIEVPEKRELLEKPFEVDKNGNRIIENATLFDMEKE